METLAGNGNGYSLGPRIPLQPEPRAAEMNRPTSVLGMKLASRILPRAADETCTSENANLCEKPISTDSLTIPIALGVAIPVVAIVVVLIYLHRRNVAQQKKEDREDPNKGLDFGLADGAGKGKKGKRKSIFFGAEKEDARSKRQLSMDMDMSTPYLLPPQLQSSRESLHSLARSIHNNEDPYRPVAQYAGSDVGSIRSARRGPGAEQASLYTSSTSMKSGHMPPPRQNSLPKSPPAAYVADPFQQPPLPTSPPRSKKTPTPPPAQDPFKSNAEPTLPQVQSTPYPEDNNKNYDANQATIPHMPDVPQQTRERKLSGGDRGVVVPEHQNPAFPLPMSATIETTEQPYVHPEPQQAQVEDVRDLTRNNSVEPVPLHGTRGSLGQNGDMHTSPQQMHAEPAPLSAPGAAADANGQYYGNDFHQDGYNQQQGYQEYQDYANYGYDDRGRSTQRSMEYAGQDANYLAAPQHESKRLSVGFRPLPPDEIMETEDPEYRANRIRSFYKEYFDDKNPHQSMAPMPGTLNPHAEEGHQDQYPPQMPPPRKNPSPNPPPGSQYYEDYDSGYLGDAAVFDPDSNTFVMPYAQPVHRRAMTPPPRGSRLRGPPPRHPMHGMHSSMGGGMSLRSGLGPPRPGSAASSRYGPVRPGSSASGMAPGARGRPKPRGPPPSALTTLPNPAKLKDDSFALLSAGDFAPPDGYKERQRGRSQSPAPERRPYALNVPISSPLVSSFDELAVIPSPHALGDSSSFLGLDFAPPKRFKENGDAMSDAGSIRSYRSNKSGISAMNNVALRNGAGRVSKLPGDTVFTQAQMTEQLKPSWNMRV